MSTTKITFDDGAVYERMMGVWSQLLGKQFIDWLNPAGGLRWIDVGSGSGAFTAQIAEFCSPSEVVGIDPSDAQIKFAQNRPVARPVNFQTGDAMALPFNADTFDAATMALVLFFIPNPMLGVSEMKRVVREGRSVSAYVWDIFGDGLPIKMIHKEFRKQGIGYPLPPSAEVSKMENLQKLWAEAGLKSIESKQINVERSFVDFEEFWSVTTSSPAVSVVFDDLEPDLVMEIRSSLQKELQPDASGRIICAAHANAIKGIV
jgi:ubiquinone/menaquinone biosynthesis C-methylase UbiE